MSAVVDIEAERRWLARMELHHRLRPLAVQHGMSDVQAEQAMLLGAQAIANAAAAVGRVLMPAFQQICNDLNAWMKALDETDEVYTCQS